MVILFIVWLSTYVDNERNQFFFPYLLVKLRQCKNILKNRKKSSNHSAQIFETSSSICYIKLKTILSITIIWPSDLNLT